MKILSCVAYGYYNNHQAASYEYISFVEILRKMGHQVHHFDYQQQAIINREAMNDFFISTVKNMTYDLVIVVTNRNQFMPEALDEARKHSVLMAWNCDDNWKWEEYSSRWIRHYTWMVTTYRHIHEANKDRYPNLLLSQWGCTGTNDGMTTKKDIEIGFIGSCYGKRKEQIKRLQRKLGMISYGRRVPHHKSWKVVTKIGIARIFCIPWNGPHTELPSQEAVKTIWNRSRISFTPVDSYKGNSVQIKARVFDQGLSGTMMLCNRNDALHEFYTPGKEYVEFEDMDECLNKASYYLAHETERRKISEAYYHRTKSEHLWYYRFNELFKEIGLT